MLLTLLFALSITNILEGSALFTESPSVLNDSTINNNVEVCSILSICNSLKVVSSELAAVRAEQKRQADLLEKPCKPETVPANCYEALKDSQKSNVTEIRVPEYSENLFKVACDQESYDGGWTIIIRRIDGSVDFYREWKDYEEGFGQVDGEYFVGLAKLHALTSSARQELLVIVEDVDGTRYETYDNFKVGGEASNYTLESVGSFNGTAGDGLTYHVGMQFTTKDRDNDRAMVFNCAVQFKGAWWYNECYTSNFAGLYEDETSVAPLGWNTNNYYKPLTTAIMMIRPKVSDLLD